MHARLKVTKQDIVIVDQRSKSFLIGFCGLMARAWSQAAATIKDTGGTNRALDEGAFTFNVTSTGGYGLQASWSGSTARNYTDVDKKGVVIGSGDTAVDPDDFALNTQIRSGEKTGTILYCGTSAHGWTLDTGADTGSFKILGIFHNVSGGSIDVKEVGVYCTGDIGVVAHPNELGYAILRDVITTISLADTEFLKVEYTISIAS